MLLELPEQFGLAFENDCDTFIGCFGLNQQLLCHQFLYMQCDWY